MALTLTVTLNDLDERVARHFAADPQEWFSNWVHSRINIEKQNLYNQEVSRLKAEGASSVPLDVDMTLATAEIKSAVELNAQAAANLPTPPQV